MQPKVVVGLSGGVDSSVTAALLIAQGYTVEGIYLECYNEPGCRTDQDKADALKVAIQLGIPFQVLDFRKAYKEKVVEYFYREYAAGRTPNPDVMCNREIKFGIFYDWAMDQGYQYVATGHYARILTKNGSLYLQRAKDLTKDQSYFLWQVPREHLSHILFPLGNTLKSEVRKKAKSFGLPTAEKPDSMGICFIGDVDVNQLLQDRLGKNPGDVIFQDHVVGKHNGLWFYTMGERGGFTLDKRILKKMGVHPEKMGPLYVIRKDQKKNQLHVGLREETLCSTFKIETTFFDEGAPTLFVRIRNLGELYPVTQFDGETITTQEPVFGVAEGQSAVLYGRSGSVGDEVVVGGGIIV